MPFAEGIFMLSVNKRRLSIGKLLVALALVVLGALAYLTFGWTKTVPNVAYTLLSGKKMTTADLRGKVYLVDFWATSCATCIKEMPQMIATYDKFKGKNFDFIAVAMKYDPPTYVINYTQTHHLPFKVVIDDDGRLAKQFYNVQMTPTTFLVDKKGRILKQFLGEPDFAALDGFIAHTLAQAG